MSADYCDENCYEGNHTTNNINTDDESAIIIQAWQACSWASFAGSSCARFAIGWRLVSAWRYRPDYVRFCQFYIHSCIFKLLSSFSNAGRLGRMPDTSWYPSPGYPYTFSPARLLTEVKTFFSKCTHIIRSCICEECKLSKPSRSPWRIFVTGFTDTSKTCRFLSHCHTWGISLRLMYEISSCSSNACHSSTVSGRLLMTYMTEWVSLRKLHCVTSSYRMPIVLYCVSCSYCVSTALYCVTSSYRMPIVLYCVSCSYCVSTTLYCVTCSYCKLIGLHCATCSYCVSIGLYCKTCSFCVPTGLLITLFASK